MNFSSGDGTGTAFHVTLPFAIDPTPTAVADNTADSIDRPVCRSCWRRITNSIWRSKQFFIEQHGGTVLPVQDGQEVVKHFLPPPPLARSTHSNGCNDAGHECLQSHRVIRQMSRPDAKTIPILAMSANAFRMMYKKPGRRYECPPTQTLSTENLLGAIARYITQK